MTELGPLSGRLLLVGCGKMGQALAAGWLAGGINKRDLLAVEPDSAAAASTAARGINVVGTVSSIRDDFVPDWVVLAVKPQVVTRAAIPYVKYAKSAQYLSIAAGTSLASLGAVLGPDARIIRSMPNTPAAVGRGMTVAVAGPMVSGEARAHCTNLLGAVGEVAWVEDETLMDAVTAVSGSAPAYVFLLIECLAEAGREAGLSAELSRQLALAAVSGAGELARASEEDAATLRRNVTSPAGTTAAALEVLMDAEGGMQPMLTRAVAAAAARSRELAG